MKTNTKTHTAGLYGFGALLSFLLILLDQGTKYLAVEKLKDRASFVIIRGVFELHRCPSRCRRYLSRICATPSSDTVRCPRYFLLPLH